MFYSVRFQRRSFSQYNFKYEKDKAALSSVFSFTLKITLTAYVALHQRNSLADNKFNLKMLALSVSTFCYSSMVAMATI